jgi:hypothetical protein
MQNCKVYFAKLISYIHKIFMKLNAGRQEGRKAGKQAGKQAGWETGRVQSGRHTGWPACFVIQLFQCNAGCSRAAPTS